MVETVESGKWFPFFRLSPLSPSSIVRTHTHTYAGAKSCIRIVFVGLARSQAVGEGRGKQAAGSAVGNVIVDQSPPGNMA
jgi:hypothetical protein